MGMKVAAAVAALAATNAVAAPPGLDSDTASWWAITAQLSNDAMDGRDTGSAAYERAARLVASKFAAAGLRPAGENGGWFQRVPMHEISITGATFRAGDQALSFLHDVTVAPALGMPGSVDTALVFAGYCAKGSLNDVRGKIVICHGTHRAEWPSASERETAVRAAGAAGMLTIADPGFTVEPPRWPYAYARTVTLATDPAKPDAFLKMTLNAAALSKLLAGSGRDAPALIAAGSAGQSLPTFNLPNRFTAKLTVSQRDISSDNIVALLPGSDPALASQTIVLTAHLDGYGRGEPVKGDRIYNGTLDDAAYVALLVRLAEHGRSYRRPVLILVVTGEEKGLLGSKWFVAHPTVPLSHIAADVNLDQLRPIFPLELLTVHAINDTSLGDDVRTVANSLGIAVQRDPEPERNLLSRSDNWPFMQAGIPATGFVFGYRPGSRSEQIYRQWYRTGYHKPQDDLNQPMDWKAAADFNHFFYKLVERVADKAEVPAWKTQSPLKPH
jgi:hypothetical protein